MSKKEVGLVSEAEIHANILQHGGKDAICKQRIISVPSGSFSKETGSSCLTNQH